MSSQKNNYTDWILHSVECELYSNNLVESSIGLLQELYKKVEEEWLSTPFVSSKTVFKRLLDKILSLIEQYENALEEEYEDYLESVVNSESKWLKDFAEERLNKDYIIPNNILSYVLFSSASELGTYKDVISNNAARISTNLTSLLRSSYLTKQPIQAVKEKLDKKKKAEEKNITTEAKTISQSAFNITDYLIFKKNKETVVYSSLLDSNVCVYCADHNGKEYKINEAPLLPFHPNCNCELIPEALINEDSPKSYTEWLESLTEKQKEQHLGKNRYKLYKSGIKPSQFIADGKFIPLDKISNN